MSVYEALSLMIAFATLVVLIISIRKYFILHQLKKTAYLAVHGLLQSIKQRGEPMYGHRTISFFILA